MNISKAGYVDQFISCRIAEFQNHNDQLLSSLKLSNLINNSGIFLLNFCDPINVHDFVKKLTDNYLLSQEELIFNDLLKQLAIFTVRGANRGKESDYKAVDIELTKAGITYMILIVNDKSLSQEDVIQLHITSLIDAKNNETQKNPNIPIIAVLGCFYGNDYEYDKGNYLKLCGQRFWEFISGDPDYYLAIIELIKALNPMKNATYYSDYCRLLNVLEAEFLRDYCYDGLTDWPKLVQLNSGSNNLGAQS